MTVLVSDTSILIDLERGGLLEAAFGLSAEFAVPDLLFERELREHGGERLIELGLRIEELGEEGTGRAIGYRQHRSALSLPDSFALELARHHGWTMLTGDGALHELALREHVDCHGVLWVLDRIQEEAVVAVQALHDGLAEMAGHPRCRLPRREIRLRLEQYLVLLPQP